MKHFLFALVAIAAISFAGCSKDDDGDSFSYDKNLIYGTWEITEAEGSPWVLETTTATFNPDGSYYGVGYFGTGSGTYKLSGNRITCYVDGEKYMWYDIVSLSETTCTLTASDDSGSMNIVCEKQ